MSKKNVNVLDRINAILDKEQRPFIAITKLLEKLGVEARKELGINKNNSASKIVQTIKDFSDDEFMFLKKGRSNYILKPCMPEDLILAEMSSVKGKSLKNIARPMPITKKDCSKIFNSLLEEGRIKISITESLDTRFFLTDSEHEFNSEYTVEEFRKAFNANDNGRYFVRICDIRNTLNWPKEIFDNMLKDLRDKGIIQLHAAESASMTSKEIEDSFVDENNFRMGTVTWYD